MTEGRIFGLALIVGFAAISVCCGIVGFAIWSRL